MIADPGIQANPFNNLSCIQAPISRKSIKFVEKGHPHGQIGIGKKA